MKHRKQYAKADQSHLFVFLQPAMVEPIII